MTFCQWDENFLVQIFRGKSEIFELNFLVQIFRGKSEIFELNFSVPDFQSGTNWGVTFCLGRNEE